jgi:iron complex transport system permease protein
LRLPRIIVAALTGGALAVSGVLFQAALKNPLADPALIGVSAGADFAAVAAAMLAPALFFAKPLFAFLGGAAACAVVFLCAWKSGLSPLRVILTGAAVGAAFTGLTQTLNYMSGGANSGAASIVSASISMKTWRDAFGLACSVLPAFAAAVPLVRFCDLLLLEDRTAQGLGIRVNLCRVLVSAAAVLLASGATAVAGAIGFVGLLAPHIGRMFVGSGHRALLPFSALLGAFTVLFADTVGRLIAYPHEIPAGVVMAVAGAPFFILLLRRDAAYGG